MLDRFFGILPSAMWYLVFAMISTGLTGHAYSWPLGVEVSICLILSHAGLEEQIDDLQKNFLSGFAVAVLGVFAPIILTVIAFTIPFGIKASLGLGVAMAATSIALSKSTLSSCGKDKSPLGKVIITGAIIDDILGIITLAIVLPIIALGAMQNHDNSPITPILATIVLTVYIFVRYKGKFVSTKLAGLIVGWPDRYFFSEMPKRIAFFSVLACRLAVWFLIGHYFHIEPIIIAFYSFLVVEPQYHGNMVKKLDGWMHKLLHTVKLPFGFSLGLFSFGFWLVGSKVYINTFFDPKVALYGLMLTVLGVIGKVVSGQALRFFPNLNTKQNRKAVGWGMVPRGEVGIAVMAILSPYFSPEVSAIGLMAVIFSTLLAGLVVPKVFAKLG